MPFIVLHRRPQPLPAGVPVPAADELKDQNEEATKRHLLVLTVGVPLAGIVGGAIGKGDAVWWLAGLTIALLGAGLLAAIIGLYYHPSPGWDVPAGQKDAFSRQQAGLVLHRMQLARNSLLLLVPSVIAVAGLLVQVSSA